MSHDIPDPITKEQIDAMSLDDATAAWAHIAQALQIGQLDDETEIRLREEFKLLKERRRTLLAERRASGKEDSP